MSTPSPWEYFSIEELSCRCGCGKMFMNADFMDKIVKLRKFYGRPLVVNSAYRCPEHDAKVGSSSEPGSGPHTQGLAMDFGVEGQNAMDLLVAAFKLGIFSGFGINQKGLGRFLHIDDMPASIAHQRPLMWTY